MRAGKIALPPTFTSQHVATHLAGRRYGVPARMVAEATTRRLGGDWRGACEAARVDVRFDPHGLINRYGSLTAARILDDLSHLAPDLVRWNLPRHMAGGTGELIARLTVTLATYHRDGEPDLALRVTTPDLVHRPQRLALRATPIGKVPTRVIWQVDCDRFSGFHDDWTEARHLWHAQHTHELRQWIGGGERTPFHTADGRLLDPAEWPIPDSVVTQPPTLADPATLAEWTTVLWDRGQLAESWAAAGVTDNQQYLFIKRMYKWHSHHVVCSPTAVVATVDLLADEPGGDVGPLTIASPSRREMSLVAQRLDGDISVRMWQNNGRDDELPGAPWPLCGRNPDLDLLRFKRITPLQLHPLVRSALLPGFDGDNRYEPVRLEVVPQSVRVRCRGQWHAVGWRDNRLTALAHSPEEEQREAALRSLGGAVSGCHRVLQTWHDSTPGDTVATRHGRRRRVWLPIQLRQVRRHLLQAYTHGDIDEVERLLTAGVDLTVIVNRNHHTMSSMIDFLAAPGLASRLITAGVPAALVTQLFNPFDAIREALPAQIIRTACVVRSSDTVTIMPWLVVPDEDDPRTESVSKLTEAADTLVVMGVDQATVDYHYRLDLSEALEQWRAMLETPTLE